MVCRTCGASIADKAIACYRCGAATAEPELLRPARATASRRWGLMLVALVAAGGLGWLAVDSEPGSAGQILFALAGAAAASLGGLFARSRTIR
jgi:hypothetical protein